MVYWSIHTVHLSFDTGFRFLLGSTVAYEYVNWQCCILNWILFSLVCSGFRIWRQNRETCIAERYSMRNNVTITNTNYVIIKITKYTTSTITSANKELPVMLFDNSLPDYSQGFGGKYGVQRDRVDKVSISFRRTKALKR